MSYLKPDKFLKSGPLSRRGFLKGGAAALAALGLSSLSPFCPEALAQKKTYRGATYITPAYRELMYGISGFIDYLRKYSADTLRVEFFDSGALMKADDLVMGLKSGTVQFIVHTTSYMTGTFPILSIVGLPGVCEELYHHGERIAMNSPLWKLINGELAKSNLFMLSAGGGVMEPEYIWSSKQKIARLADLKGKRCRIMSAEGSEIMKRFGVESIRVPSAGIPLALQRGTVDALVANISTVMGRSLYEQLKSCLKIPVTALSIGIFFQKDLWEKMDAAEKKAFWEAGMWYDENAVRMVNDYIYPKEKWPMIKSLGLEIDLPTDEDLKTFAENAIPVHTWWKKKVGEEVGSRAIDLAMGRI